jgi:hypothetical protein
MELNEITTDATLETEGVWRKFEDAEFRIAGSNSPRYQRSLRRHAQSATAKLKTDPATQDRMLIEAMADTILIEWKGKVTLKGKQLAVTRENKVTLLSVPFFRNWVAEQMQDISNFRAAADAEEDADAK